MLRSDKAMPSSHRNHVRGITLVASIVVAAWFGFGLARSLAGASDARVVPAPALDAEPGSSTSQVAVLAGGCFWGVQGVYQHTMGVTSAVSGYAGGEKNTAEYESVGTGRTGHAESVQITFDPRAISYGRLLQIFFSVVHDPTQLNRQGPDAGPQYRSTIFPTSPEQARIAKAYIAQLTQARTFRAAIATTIELDRAFYAAEAYHQDYLTRHPGDPYIAFNDLPKIQDLKRLFPDVYRQQPVLVGSRR
jgi:peptide-methionine (S)-S-oxide reductase